MKTMCPQVATGPNRDGTFFNDCKYIYIYIYIYIYNAHLTSVRSEHSVS